MLMASPISHTVRGIILELRVEDLKHSVRILRAALESSVSHKRENLKLLSGNELTLIEFKDEVIGLGRSS